MAILPFGVLATSATSCDQDEGIHSLEAVSGRFTGTEQRHHFVVEDDRHGLVTLDPLTGQTATFAARDRQRQEEALAVGGTACDSSGMTCWRVEDQVIEVSRDGGTTWSADLVVTAEEQSQSVEGEEPSCHEKPSAWMVWVAVLDTDGAVTVAVTARHAGVWLRAPDGEWQLIPRDRFDVEPVEDPPGPVRGRLRTVYVHPARSQDGWSERTQSPGVTPTPPCASPTQRTVTPNPSNGPPTTYAVCP
jgi:hypothetical protein